MRDFRYLRTELGEKLGWTYMHNGGWVKNPEHPFLAHNEYTPATMTQLEEAVERGELRKQYGRKVHVGGILYNWVPDPEFSESV